MLTLRNYAARGFAKTLLIVAPEPPPYYGAAVVTGRLLQAARQGRVHFRHLDIIDPAGTRNMGKLVPANFMLALKHYLLMLQQLITHRDIEAVYVLVAFTNAPAFWRDFGFILLARLFRKSIVVHCHDNMVEEFCRRHVWPTRGAVRWALESARAVVVLCPRIASATQRVAPAARVDIVANGLDLESELEEQASPSAVSAEPRVLFLSQLSEEKGFLTALQVAARLRQQNIKVSFQFAGSWKSVADAAWSRRWIRERDLEPFVRIQGPVSEKEKVRLLKAAHVFLFPTNLRHEGQPLVIIEAMAAGLPVITTDIGCISDTVVDGVTGFVVRPGDVDAIVDKLTALIRDAAARDAMSKAARIRYQLNYTGSGFIERMLAVLHDIAPSVVAQTRAETTLTAYERT